jgi:hypothetical protein
MQQHEHSVRHHQGKREIRAGNRIATLITLIKLVTLTPKQTQGGRRRRCSTVCGGATRGHRMSGRQVSAPASEAERQ